jgi:hypothetical protein
MVFDGFGGFGCFLVVFVVLVVAGRAPWGTPYHQILMFFGGFGGSGRCWWGPNEAHPCHQNLMVFDGFGCFFVVLLLLAVAGAAPGGTPYHQILMVFDGLGGASCCW